MSKTSSTIKKPTQTIINSITKDPLGWAATSSIPALVNVLKYLSETYYNTGKSIVSDTIFDQLKDILEERDPKNKFLKTVGAPISKDAVPLPYYMGSLDKIVKDVKKLNKWLEKYKGPYVLSDKLDGVSGLLYKKNSSTIILYTRGNGNEGQDVSHLIKYLISNAVIKKIPEGMAIRGEMILSKESFEKVKIKHELKNARNTVSGIVNAKKPTEELAKQLEFIAYGILSSSDKISVQLDTLEALGIPTVDWTNKLIINNEILENYFNERIKECDYEIDGIVVIDDGKGYKLAKNENPDYGFAFKNQDVLESAEVIIKEIEWYGTKDSYLVPTVIIEPTELDGVTINRATGHNAKFILDNKLGPGSVVRIIRSGAVIPHITDTIKGTEASLPNIPTKDYKWSKSGVDIIYTGKEKEILDQIATSYVTFFFRKIGVKFLSEGISNKLVKTGYTTPIEVIGADEEELYDIRGLGKKVIDKIYENIEQAFDNIKLETLMAASNMFGRGLGSKKIALILKNYPDILNAEWNEKTIQDKVLSIKGFDVLTANRFAKNFKNFVKFYADLREVIDFQFTLPVKPSAKKTGTAGTACTTFTDKSVVFTGFRNEDMENYIESCGGKVSSGVSKNTYMVVYAESDKISSNNKYKKAKELGIILLSSTEFENKYIK
jgi:NAD-dependent DNA ligase